MPLNLIEKEKLEILESLREIDEERPNELEEARKAALKPYELSRLRKEINEGTVPFFEQYMEQMETLAYCSRSLGGVDVARIREEMGKHTEELATMISLWIPKERQAELLERLLFGEHWLDGRRAFAEPRDSLRIMARYLHGLSFENYSYRENSDNEELQIMKERWMAENAITKIVDTLQKEGYEFSSFYSDILPYSPVIRGVKKDKEAARLWKNLDELVHEPKSSKETKDELTIDQNQDHNLVLQRRTRIIYPLLVLGGLFTRELDIKYDHHPKDALREAEEWKSVDELLKPVLYEVADYGLIIEIKDLKNDERKESPRIKIFSTHRRQPGFRKMHENYVHFENLEYHWDEVGGRYEKDDYLWTKDFRSRMRSKEVNGHKVKIIPPDNAVDMVRDFANLKKGGSTSNLFECIKRMEKWGIVERKGKSRNIRLTKKGFYLARFYIYTGKVAKHHYGRWLHPGLEIEDETRLEERGKGENDDITSNGVGQGENYDTRMRV